MSINFYVIEVGRDFEVLIDCDEFIDLVGNGKRYEMIIIECYDFLGLFGKVCCLIFNFFFKD